MSKKIDYSDKLASFHTKVTTEDVSVKLQKVVPVVQTVAKIDKNSLTQFQFWMSKTMHKTIKLKAIDEGTSAKELVLKAIEAYLK